MLRLYNMVYIFDISSQPKIDHEDLSQYKSQLNQHIVSVETNGSAKDLNIAPKPTGYGSSVNGGELLMLALATCFCNDIYREAAKRNISVSAVDVEFSGDFGADGEPGSNLSIHGKCSG